MKARTEISGTEANTPPQKELRLPISEIAAIRIADIKILII